MMDTYVPVLVMMLLCAITVAGILVLSYVLGPKEHSEMKDDPFECGTVGSGGSEERYGVKFYLVAMIFILFDVEIVFMYPWAIRLQALGWYGFWVMMAFMVVLAVGLTYIWKRGVLDWA